MSKSDIIKSRGNQLRIAFYEAVLGLMEPEDSFLVAFAN